MAINLNGCEELVREAVQQFWHIRHTKGVRSGGTLDGFINVLTWVVHNNGLPNAEIITGVHAKLPGFFRPAKSWDVLVMNQGTLIAAIELKSIADSFGKNSNNRNEEALGSGVDIQVALEEDAFEGLTRLFTGYLILVEDCPETQSTVDIRMRNFRAMTEFLADQNSPYERGPLGLYPDISGVSYMNRFDILCRRLMQKQLYSATSVIKTPRSAIDNGSYNGVSPDTNIGSFLASFAGYIESIAAMQDSSNFHSNN